MLQLSCLSGLDRLDVVVVDCDACGGRCPCLLHSVLCCPNDSLDDDTVVIEIIGDDELLKDLAIAASLPPGQELLVPTAGRRGNENNVKSGSVAAGETTGRGPRGCWAGVSSAGDVPRLPAVHDALLDKSLWTAWRTTTTTSSLAAEPPPPPAAAAAVSRLVVPSRKRHSRSVSVTRGTRPWSSSLDMPRPSTPTTPRHNPSNNRRRSDGVRQQGLVSRRRWPQSTISRRLLQKACSHCDTTETPHWRAGPDGPRTLCNACGIRYTREQAAAAAAAGVVPAVGEPRQEGT